MNTRRWNYGLLLRLILAGLALPIASALARPEPSIQVVFSPERGATAAIAHLIDEATSSVQVAAYSFTSRAIARALADARRRGVDVRAVLDQGNETDRYSIAPLLADAAIPIRIDHLHAVMHDKFLIIDGSSVETGSFNFTKAAEETNAENVIILHGYPDVAGRYQAHWQELWDQSQPYHPPPDER